jgi:hypothetical protein
MYYHNHNHNHNKLTEECSHFLKNETETSRNNIMELLIYRYSKIKNVTCNVARY